MKQILLILGLILGLPSPSPAADSRADGSAISQNSAHWAYRRPRPAEVPDTRDPAWPRGAIDRFILSALEARGSRAGPDADRATLCRRVYFDLIGLPPTPEDIDAFVQDQRPDAFTRLADRLLASPRFGEHWARHWLDLVRFAESVTLRGLIFKEAWRYRDYVIDVFNLDRRYDRFIQEQLAGDLLPASSLEERRRQLVATTFLMLGNTNFEEQDKEQLEMDFVDEQLDVIGKAFLAQTITCARCHDHKFDPIPTRDYYALAGILRNVIAFKHDNVSGWTELPLPVEPDEDKTLRRSEDEIAAVQAEIKQAKEMAQTAARTTPGSQKLAVRDLPGIVVDNPQARRVGEWQVAQEMNPFIGEDYLHDLGSGKGEKTLTFHPDLAQPGRYEVRFAYPASARHCARVPLTVFHADGETTIHVDERQVAPIDGRFLSLGFFRFETSGFAYVLVSNEGTDGLVVADAIQFLRVDSSAGADGGAAAVGSPAAKAGPNLRSLQKKLKELQENSPRRPMAMAVLERTNITDAPIHLGGSVHRLGEIVPRGFLTVAAPPRAELPLPTDQSGRRQLADWMVSAENPLAGRVMVNRVWLWLMGEGLVRTPDNFGTTGEPPSHPELLDYLALRFISPTEGDQGFGWSMKRLIREIVLSRVYQLGSAGPALNPAADSAGHWFGHGRRRRLTAEQLRDALLVIGGRLQLSAPAGPGFPHERVADYEFVDDQRRRSIYVPVFRNALPDLFTAFDFAPPTVVSGKREESIVPSQALFLLNHPFVLEQARGAARRVLTSDTTGPTQSPSKSAAQRDALFHARLERAYRMALGRPPTPAETVVAQHHFDGHAASEESWAEFFQALFACFDFRYLN